MARWKGLEPLTYWFVASHSIQLSYQRIGSFYDCHSIISQRLSKINSKFLKSSKFFNSTDFVTTLPNIYGLNCGSELPALYG